MHMLSDAMHDGLFQHRGGQAPAGEVLLATVLDEALGDVVAEPLPGFLFGVARRQPVPGVVEELACQWEEAVSGLETMASRPHQPLTARSCRPSSNVEFTAAANTCDSFLRPRLIVWKYETCWCGVRKGATVNWVSDRKQAKACVRFENERFTGASSWQVGKRNSRLSGRRRFSIAFELA